MPYDSVEFSRLSWPRVHVPESCRNGARIVVGIDEAGRGPVLGSLIYCAAFWPVAQHEAICGMGFDDSKALGEGERERLFDALRAQGSIGWVIEEISATEISEEMLRSSPVSLNKLSYDHVVAALDAVRAGPGPPSEPPVIDHVYIDTVGDPEHYRQTLIRALGGEADFGAFTIEKKADATYKVVSAASIIAKVTRDALLRVWVSSHAGSSSSTSASSSGAAPASATATAVSGGPKVGSKRAKEPEGAEEEEDCDKGGREGATDLAFGSGYPGDPKCVEWLGRNMHPVFGFPDLVRFSWSTCRTYLETHGAAQFNWPCDEEERAGADISAMFSAQKRAAKRLRRSTVRQRCGLERVTAS